MKTITTTAVVALMIATLGLAALPPAMAQDAAAAPVGPAVEQAPPAPPADMHVGPRQGPRGMGGGLLDFGRGAEGIEIALVRLSHRLDLSEDQTTLLETLKTDALAAAEDFATTTDALRPAEGETFEMSQRLENRIAMEEAQLAALQAIQPSYAAFFDSLTDDQKASLRPEPGDRPGPDQRDHRPGPRGEGPSRG